MDFGQSFPLDPLPSGWQHRKFWTRSPMRMAFAVKDGVPSMRFETDDSASMLFRHVDIDLAAYPMLAWRWYIELPIRSPLDERTREGDDHPARLFLRFATDHGEKRAMEVIWGNRLNPGEYKYIGGFPHFVADAGDERTGRWLDEQIDLARVYGEIWKDAVPPHSIDIAVFCDSDDTHTASISTSSASNGSDVTTMPIAMSLPDNWCVRRISVRRSDGVSATPASRSYRATLCGVGGGRSATQQGGIVRIYAWL
jgi:hypothetical protein